jgi:putative redox protein
MQALLLAAASCSGADVVVILEKMRGGLEQLSIQVSGKRRGEHPRRYESVSLKFSVSGGALDPAKVERAVALSIEKYCSVLHSFDPQIDIAYEIDLA